MPCCSPLPAPPTGTPVKRSPHTASLSRCVPTPVGAMSVMSPPARPGSARGPRAMSRHRRCPPGSSELEGLRWGGWQRRPQVPEEYEETPCLDLVAGSPSTLHTPHSQRARPPPPPLAGQAGISQLIPREALHQGSAPERRHKDSLADCRSTSNPSDLFHLGINRQMDRVLRSWHSGLET